METRTALAALLTTTLLAPTAVALPGLVDSCLSSPLASCLDSVTPRAKPSRMLPDAMQPASAPATPETEPPAAVEPQPHTEPDAPGEPAATPVEPPAPSSDVDAATPGPAPPIRALLSLLVVLAALGLIVLVLVLDAKERRRARRTTLADAMRARAMQSDIDAAWRTARPAAPETPA